MTGPGPIALVVNPAATRTSRALRAEVTRVLSPLGLEWSLVTTGPGDAGRLAAQAAREGAAVVVTLGGDGTVADVAGVLAGGPVALAPMPGGSTNVFARAVGWPRAPGRAVPLLAEALAGGAVREAALGRLEIGGQGRVFAINAGVGLDAATVEWIEARPRTKRRLRQAGFAVATAVTAVRAGGAARLTVSVDGAAQAEALAVLVACGTPYTYLGARPLDLVPGAAFDGRLAWVALTRARPHEIGRLLLRAIRGRDLPLDGPAVRGGSAAVELVVRSRDPAPVQADGEPLGRHHEVRIAPGPVLRVVAPITASALKTDVARTI
jgi:diacylglycerol kinase family enzyme